MRLLKYEIMIKLRGGLQNYSRYGTLSRMWNDVVEGVWIEAEERMGIVLTYSGEQDGGYSWIGDVR